MNIDWANFTPWTSTAGGLLIGVASAMFILLNGRVLGISSIVGEGIRSKKGDRLWRVTFIAGLLMAPLLFSFVSPLPPVEVQADWKILLVGGLAVGVGTRYGAGCTSGQGVCGLSRLSVRSLIATLCFMSAGFVTVFLVRHVFN